MRNTTHNGALIARKAAQPAAIAASFFPRTRPAPPPSSRASAPVPFMPTMSMAASLAVPLFSSIQFAAITANAHPPAPRTVGAAAARSQQSKIHGE